MGAVEIYHEIQLLLVHGCHEIHNNVGNECIFWREQEAYMY